MAAVARPGFLDGLDLDEAVNEHVVFFLILHDCAYSQKNGQDEMTWAVISL